MRRSRGKSDSARGKRGERRYPVVLRHPKRVIAVAVVLLTALSIIGLHVERRLSPTSLEVPGTSASKANTMLREHFGDSAPFAILLRGPGPALDRQGPELIRTLRLDPKVTTLSPWDRGSVARLRPSPDRALILVDFHVDTATAVNTTVPKLNKILEEKIRPPVHATQSGFASLSRAIQDESISASERGELIAIPILLIVLLLVFRSPIAAAIPLGFGGVTVLASRGILLFITHWLAIDAFALTVCTMMGLALGVDYALLMVSRFREELEGGADPLEAAATTRSTAGRTVIFAGSTLLLSMLVSVFILPGSLLASLAGTVMMVVTLSVIVATVVGPAVLTLLGPNVNRWRIGAPPGDNSRLMTIVNACLRRPAAVAALIGAVVLVLAAPAIGLKTGPPSPEQLSTSDPVRLDAERIDTAIGPGWDAPFIVVASTENGSMTDKHRLAALNRFQDRLAAEPGIQAVIGPGQISKRVAPLQKTGNALFSSNGNTPAANKLAKLGKNLNVAAGGVSQMRSGISEAASGAGLLADGSDRASTGAHGISHGLAKAESGSTEAVMALEKFASGTHRLVKAQEKASVGALAIKLGLQSMIPNLKHNATRRSRALQKTLKQDGHVKLPQLVAPAQAAEAQLKVALAKLGEMTVGKTDPNYAATLAAVQGAVAAVTGTNPATGQPYAPGYAGLPTELSALQTRLVKDGEESAQITGWLVTANIELKRLYGYATRLNKGLKELIKGGKELERGSARLAKEAKKLETGLGSLAHGAAALAGGITQLGAGATTLEQSLASGYQRSYPIQSGLRRASVRVTAGHAELIHKVTKAHHSSPGLFNSGYFVLSAVDGAPKAERERAATSIDLKRGGDAATTLVISKYGFNSPGSIALGKRLDGQAVQLGREADAQTGVAGGAATLNDYSKITRERIPYVVLAITITTFLVLLLVLRALPLAAIAVGLNLATVGVAFGVLTLLFNLPASVPLGGRTYVDAVGAVMIFGVVFGLSIDYAVFLLIRMREHYDENGDNAAAISFGLDKTARVITGAALIMMAVFVAFAGAPIATVSQLGTGLTVAVLLDATVVRIVLLPALMLLVGDRVWWFPKFLERIVPRLNV